MYSAVCCGEVGDHNRSDVGFTAAERPSSSATDGEKKKQNKLPAATLPWIRRRSTARQAQGRPPAPSSPREFTRAEVTSVACQKLLEFLKNIF